MAREERENLFDATHRVFRAKQEERWAKEVLRIPDKVQEVSRESERSAHRSPASWTVRSSSLPEPREQVRWKQVEAHRLASQESRKPPEHRAEVYQTMANTMRERLVKVYSHGQTVAREEQERSR